MTMIFPPKKSLCWSRLGFLFRLPQHKKMNLWATLGLLYMFIHLGGKIRFYCQSKHLRRRRLDADPQQHAIYKQHYIRNAQGMWLYIKSWIPRNDSNSNSHVKGLVFLAHGLGEHMGRYEYVAQYLNQHGFIVFGLDHQAHGKSDGDRMFVESFDHFATDYIQFIHHVLDLTFPGAIASNQDTKETTKLASLPRFILGHSMGGAITLATVLRLQSQETHITDRSRFWNGVILSGPALRADPALATPVKVWASRMLSHVLPKLPIGDVSGDGLSRDRDIVEHYEQDPLVPKTGMTARLAAELLVVMPTLVDRATECQMPILLLHGAEDKIAMPQGSQAFYDHCTSADLEMKIYPELYHEIFNSCEKNQVLQDVVTWMTRRLKSKTLA